MIEEAKIGKVPQISEIVNSMVKGLFKSGWDIAMRSYWQSQEFRKVIEQLVAITNDNKHYCPQLKTALMWMKVCPYHNIKCVIMVDDIHNNIMANHGIPFSRNNEDLQRDVLREQVIVTNRDIKSFMVPVVGNNKNYNYNLERWCKQGVLMMPLAPTYRIGGSAHYEIWKDFRARVIEAIEENHKNISWVLVGDRAQKYEHTIDSKYTIPVDTQPELSVPDWPEKINNKLKVPIDWK